LTNEDIPSQVTTSQADYVKRTRQEEIGGEEGQKSEKVREGNGRGREKRKVRRRQGRDVKILDIGN